MTVFVSCATRPNASVVGPGTASANSKFAVSSRWQKYCERKSSGKQTTWAPERAASSMREVACARFSAALAPTAICTRATLNLSGVGTIRKSTRKAGARPYAAGSSVFFRCLKKRRINCARKTKWLVFFLLRLKGFLVLIFFPGKEYQQAVEKSENNERPRMRMSEPVKLVDHKGAEYRNRKRVSPKPIGPEADYQHNLNEAMREEIERGEQGASAGQFL